MLRVVRAAKAAGITVRTLEVTADGTIRVSTETVPPQPSDIFDQWQDKL